jgi:hypothetical protein
MSGQAGSVPGEGRRSPSPARGEASQDDAAAARREVRAALAQRTVPLWPAHAPVKPSMPGATRQQCGHVHRLAGLELQHHALVLRRITTAYVVSVAKPYFEAGWSIADILRALDWTPHGQRYPHDALTGITHPGAWFAARLRTWTSAEGTPLRSVDQRVAAEAEHRRAAAIAAAQGPGQRQVPRQSTAQASIGGAEAADVVVGADRGLPEERRSFRERWATQIAAGQAEMDARRGATGEGT